MANGTCSIDGCERPIWTRNRCSAHYRQARRSGDLDRVNAEAGSTLRWLRERFDADDTDECFSVPGRRVRRWPVLIDGRKVSAHVIVCEWANGPRPVGMEVAHSCGNGHLGCVNRRHLRWATHQENIADKDGHGTAQRAEQHPQAVLAWTDVREIRRRYTPRSASDGAAALAREFGVSASTVNGIVAGKTWREGHGTLPAVQPFVGPW